jgi:hypothetical protein
MSNRNLLVGVTMMLVIVPLSLTQPAALADEGKPPVESAGCVGWLCEATASDSGDPEDGNDETGGQGADEAAQDRKVRAAEAAIKARLAKYNRAIAAYNKCLTDFTPSAATPAPSCGPVPAVPDDLTLSLAVSSNGAPPPITNAQAGAIAAARLRIPTVAPGIGPSPELNRWKMAAVGYPLWLWADGPTHVGPVSDSVGGLSVSLEARVTKVTFRMGDGKTVDCAGRGQRWTRAVKPGEKSPSCGYSYSKPSLPEGTYRVAAIANWAVTWTVNDESGVINVPAVDTAELPVGELQVLVR